MITYNNIIKALNNFADNHFFIKSFSHGNIEEMDLGKDLDTPFPLMHVVYTGASYADKQKEYSFEIYMMDLPPDKEGSKQAYQIEVISDLEQCAEDLLADLSNGFNIFSDEFLFDRDSASTTPLEEEGSNVISGISLDIAISVPFIGNACDAPLTGVTPTSGTCADGTIKATDGSDVVTTITTVASGGTYTFAKISILEQDDSLSGYGRIDKNVKVTNADITTVTETATEIEIAVDVVTPSGIAYNKILYGQRNTYNTYDIGWWLSNRASSLIFANPANPETVQDLNITATPSAYSVLKYNNIHGNTFRFTAQDGTQTFVAGAVIQDHLYYLEWINTAFANTFLTTHYTNAEADTTDGGATNHWRLSSAEELASLFDNTRTTGFVIEMPFTAVNRWVSTRYSVSTTLQLYNWAGQLFSRRNPSGYSYQGAYCRKGTW